MMTKRIAIFGGMVACGALTTLCAAAQTIKVAAVQLTPQATVQSNVVAIVTKLGECAQQGVRVAVFPECATTGSATNAIETATTAQLQQAEQDIANACSINHIWAVIGMVYDDATNRYDCAVTISDQGTVVERRAKIQLTAEDETWATRGNEVSVFRIDDIQCTALVGEDQANPMLIRLAALAGANLVFHVANESGSTISNKLISARADENDVFVVHANCPAPADGGSRVIGPNGIDVVALGADSETFVATTIDMSAATRQTALNSYQHVSLEDWWRAGTDLVVIRP